MSLFDIAFRNIKRNLNNYFLYLASMVFSIMIYFTFTSIQYNSQVIELTKSSLKVETSFRASAIIIAVFSAMFIWYSNAFFTKRRKKEVALYCMMGVRKKQVARMLFYENLVMGAVALFIGIVFGSLFTKLFIMILMHLMDFNVSVVFTVSWKALMNTLLVFLLLFFMASLHAYTLIYRFQLVELFKSESKNQNQPKGSIFFGILSAALIGTGYYLAFTFNYSKLYLVLVILIITVTGTYFLFSSLMVYAIKLSKKHKGRYFKNLNIVNTSLMMFRIKSHSRTIATIAILSATTLTAVGVASSLYYDQTTNLAVYAPFSYTYFTKEANPVLDKKIDNLIKKYPLNHMQKSISASYIETEINFPNLDKLISTKKKNKDSRSVHRIMSESDLRKLLDYKKSDEDITFDNGEAIIFFGFFYDEISYSPIGKSLSFDVDHKKFKLLIKDYRKYLPANLNRLNDLIIVKDNVYAALLKQSKSYSIRAFDIANQEDSKELTSSMNRLISTTKKTSYISPLVSYYDLYVETMSRYGLTIFLAAFIGLVFLICTGSIIFFKLLSEAGEDKTSYEILHKIGASKEQIKSSIAKQMLLMFSMPLLVGIVHCSFALSMLRPIMTTNFLVPIVISVTIYTMIYLLFYLLTVSSYNKIVSTP